MVNWKGERASISISRKKVIIVGFSKRKDEKK